MTLKKHITVLRKSYAEWLKTEPSVKDAADQLAIIQQQLEEFQSAAQAAQYDGLAMSATIWRELIAKEETTQSDTDKFMNWLKSVAAYLRKPEEPSLISPITETMPPELQAELTILFGADDEQHEPLPVFDDDEETVEESTDNVDFEALESILREPDNSISNANTVLGVILEQVISINPLLLECAQNIKDQLAQHDKSNTPNDSVLSSINNYIDHISSLEEVAEVGTLRGFSAIFNALTKNCRAILDGAECDIQEVSLSLEYFPSLLESCLRQPEDDAHCLALIKILEYGGWSKPLYYAESKRLLYALVGDLEFASGNLGKRRKQSISADDTSLTISDDVTQEMVNNFFIETPPLIEKLVDTVANIHDVENVRQKCSGAQRLCHTLKGSANLIGVQGIANFAHYLEDILQFLGDNDIKPSAELGIVVEEAVDRVAVMLECLQGHNEPPDNQEQFLTKLLDCANQVERGELSATNDTGSTTLPQTNDISETVVSEPDTTAREDSIRIPRKALEEILDAVSETAITLGQLEESLRRLRDNRAGLKYYDTVLKKRQSELEDIVRMRGLVGQEQIPASRQSEEEQFDSLEIDEYNELYSAVQSYIEVVSDSVESAKDIANESSALENVFAVQKRLNKKMQSVAMSARMVPASDLSPRLKRIVRQTCRATGKQAELTITGDSLMLDASIFNQLAAPLMHLLRNAVDHGIEPSTDSQKDDSAPTVCPISLNYSQTGNFIQILCADEGRGLDYKKIHQQAIEKGLIKKGDKLQPDEIARLIFQPSLTTRSEATQVSGRGVGLDVARDAISRLNGSINVYDNKPRGTVVECRFPVRMITDHCVIIEVEREVYAIPTSSLKQVADEGLGQVIDSDGQPVYQLGDEQYPIRMLASLVGFQFDETITAKRPFLILQNATQVIAIGVDAVLATRDCVIKDIGRFVAKLPGIAGVTLLGDGKVVPVLNLIDLLESEHTRSATAENYRPVSKSVRLPSVLVVDDSLSVRNNLGELVRDMGFNAVLARDGIEALKELEQESFVLVLTDLEMPRMSGLELTSYIRRTPNLSELPVILVTSRTMQKHRDKAAELGVTGYVTKPYLEDELSEIIRQHALIAA